MTAIHRRLALAGAVTASALLLAACGSDDDSSGTGESTGGSDFNSADVMFAQMMIPHHEQAVEMAGLAAGRTSDEEVEDLATAIEKAQGPEIRTLRAWLKDWGKPEAGDAGGHAGHGSDSGMMSEDDMAGLEAAKGTAFDKKFAELMIDHHEGAIEMAEDEQQNGRNADAKELADAIVQSQSAEVKQLEDILDRL